LLVVSHELLLQLLLLLLLLLRLLQPGGQLRHLRGAEEPPVQNLQQVQGRFVYLRARAAGVHQGDVDDGRVVIAGILSALSEKERSSGALCLCILVIEMTLREGPSLNGDQHVNGDLGENTRKQSGEKLS